MVALNFNHRPVSQWSTNKLTATLRCFNLLNGIGLILSGTLCLLTGFVSLGFSSVTVSVYIAYVGRLHLREVCRVFPSLDSDSTFATRFFGIILCCAELKITNLQHKLIRNCGFLFTFIGRALFIVL
jgi:hypothetical protein